MGPLETKHLAGRADDPSTWSWGLPGGPVEVFILEKQEDLIATTAHELGHACTQEEDLERRSCPSDEWAWELAADWHAYRWGFGRDIVKTRRSRELVHHLGGPGSEFAEEINGIGYHYRITRNFVVHLVTVSDHAESPGT